MVVSSRLNLLKAVVRYLLHAELAPRLRAPAVNISSSGSHAGAWAGPAIGAGGSDLGVDVRAALDLLLREAVEVGGLQEDLHEEGCLGANEKVAADEDDAGFEVSAAVRASGGILPGPRRALLAAFKPNRQPLCCGSRASPAL